MLARISNLASCSPALRTAAILGAGGLGFALGNLLLARALTAEEFGLVSLVLALVQIGAAFGSLGLPTLIVRKRFIADRDLLRTAGALAGVSMLVLSLGALTFYRLPPTLVYLLGAIVVIAALGRVAGAVFQAAQRFGASLFLTQIHNWLLLASVPVIVLLERRTAVAVAAFMLCSYLVTTTLGWRHAARMQRPAAGRLTWTLFRSEGLSAAGVGLSTNLMFQLDRLVIGRTLPMSDLATYAVVAAIAGSAFRMLQVAAGYTLTPRLRAANDRAEALGMLGREALFVFGLAVLVGVLVVLATPSLVQLFAGDRYHASLPLVGAVVAVGFIRIWQAFATSIVSAIGSARELFWLAIVASAATLLTIVAATSGSRYGLVGLVCGMAVGWLAFAAGASILAMLALSRISRRANLAGSSMHESFVQ